MSKDTKFAVIYDLNGLSETELDAYKRKAAVYFELDPDTNPFDIVWMNDDGTGFRRRQLYARRGTTDILRHQRNITVLSMIQHDGPGYVSFTATGKDVSGRQEIAVGAHSTAGLQGEKLAAAVSTAETRAGRRLTLKFVGMGILDSSEVSDSAEVKAVAPGLTLSGSAAVIPPMPVFAPSAAPFNAQIAVAPQPAPPTDPLADTVAQGLAEAAEVSRLAYEAWQTQTRAEARKALAEKNPDKWVAPDLERPEKSFSGVEPVSAPVETVPVAETPKRKRGPNKKRNTVDIASPGQVSEPLATVSREEGTVGNGPSLIPPLAESVPPQANLAVPPQANPAPHQSILAPPQPAPIADFPGKPTKEQEEQYRALLRSYANNVLPAEGGMTPSPGIGGPSAKLRLFAEQWVGKSTQLMTVDEWNQFFESLKNFHSRNGAKGLVKYIEDCLVTK